jgi:murein DD-endopeptidase MepM/ murein hydrolase activator NlpD
MKSTPNAVNIARYLVLVASCFVFGGCAFNFQLPGANKSRASLGLLSNRIDTSFGERPRAIKEISATRGREYDFVLYSVNEDGQVCITADNRREAPVSVRIEMTREDNIVSDRSFPLEYVVPPNTKQCIARISRLYKDRDFSFQYSNSWMPGDYTARHNPKDGYRLPWQQGEHYPVSQAYGGPITTHTDRSSRFAVDFSLPEGTPVLAARTGMVVNLEDYFSAGAPDKALLDKVNFVDILHDDGTIATYAHLAERSVVVHLGQLVFAGEKLGLSGSTGYSSGPHLHFAVWRPESGVKGFVQLSLPVEFCMDGRASCAPVEYGTTVPNRSTAAHLGTGRM